MTTRFKFKGSAFPLAFKTRDDGEFKESQHPRAANGQFSSGGGAGGKQIHGGVTAPKKGTAKHQIWTFAAKVEEAGGKVNPDSVLMEAAKAGVTLNKSNVSQCLSPYKKFQAAAKAEGAPTMHVDPSVVKPVTPPPAAPAKPKLENNLETFESVASASGMPKEGNFGGITYYKNSEGDKVSYSPSSKSWQLKEADGKITKGTDLNELAELLGADTEKIEKQKASNAKAEAKAKQAAENAKKQALELEHSTQHASQYGSRLAATQHHYTSKGAVSEKGFNAGIKASIHAYKGSSYMSINKAMRFDADYSTTSPDTMRHVLNLQRAFKVAAPTTADIQVGRKVGMSALKTMALDAGLTSLNDLQPGQVLRDPGVISTSHKEGVWSGDVKFNINVPKGSKAIDISETINSGEAELMLPPESGLRIKSVQKGEGNFKYIIECEHVA